LYNVAQGRFEGELVIPRQDMCFIHKAEALIHFMLKGVVYCRTRGHNLATIYDVLESNESGIFHLLLRNGAHLPLTGIYLLMVGVENVYNAEWDSKLDIIGVFVYRKRDRYQPSKHTLEKSKLFQYCEALTFYINPWSGVFVLFGVPGPIALAVKVIDKPMNGKIIAFGEIRMIFYPHDRDKNLLNFHFNPSDPSFLHLIKYPRNMARKIRSVDIMYRTI
jgi:hypothetical protein